MDNNHQDLKANETVHEDISSVDKLTESYLLLKKRIFGTHEVIKQYNDKLKECEKLKQDLDAANKQTKKVTCNYNSILAKSIKLELQTTEYKKNIESLTTQVNEHTIKAAADQQYIQQLICKIKDIEGTQNDKIMQYDLEKSSLQVKVKELEQELKNVKKSYDLKLKKMEKKLPAENGTKAKLRDFGTNTTLTKNALVQKPQVTEKGTLTDEFYKTKDHLYPIFCAKCEILIEPAPLEKICKIMTNSCPKLIEKITSPRKKSPSPLRVSTDIINEQCKTENLPNLSDTPPPHLQSQNNNTDFISTNVLPSHTMPINRTDFCNNFSPMSNLINQNGYYIGSTPINPLSMANSNTTGLNNHCESMATMVSSLSIISSLQKKVDTLETKLKKQLNKRRSEQNSSCCQSHQQNSCHMYDMSNSMQFNFIELWKRMADFYENKETKCSNVHTKLKKGKLSRLKLATKRLRNAHSGSWKIEPVAKHIEQGSGRKKSKKCKYRYSTLLNKSKSSLNSIGSVENLDNDSDANSSVDTFHNSPDSKININLRTENVPSVGVFTSQSNKIDTNADEAVEIVRNSTESIKSIGGETDSGILSDSIESGKLLQLEVDIDIRSKLREHTDMLDMASSKEGEPCITESAKLQKCKPEVEGLIEVASNLSNPSKVVETNVVSKLAQCTDERVEEIVHRHAPEISQCNSMESQVRTCMFDNTIRKRKMSELQELKRSGKRQELLKKLKNLKKNKTPVKLWQNISEYQNVQKYENENSNIQYEENAVGCNLEISKEDDYIPKKKSRIAHVPKSTGIEQKISSSNSAQFKKRFIKSVEHTIAQNIKNDCIDFNASKKDINEIQGNNTCRIEELNLTTLNTANCCTENILEDNVYQISVPEVEDNNPLNVHTNDRNHSDIKSDAGNISKEPTEFCETKNELTNQSEEPKHDRRNDALNICITSKADHLLDQAEDRHAINTPEKNYVNETNFSIEENNKNVFPKQEDINTGDKLNIPVALGRLQRHINANKCSLKSGKGQQKKVVHVCSIANKFVKKQLQRLIDSDWQTTVHWDVIEKFVSTCSARIIAKGIVDFLSSEQECNKSLDNSHTPPAPLMTKSQQKIAALLVDLEEAKPSVFQLVQTGIEYRLFRLNQPVQRCAIDSLARMYTVLARIKKDREKVRIFCCDALYCLGLNAVIILYTVFTCWPEVFPNNETNTKLLPKCIAHLVMAQQATDHSKLFALKNLLSVFYKYPMGTISKDLLTELLMALQENSRPEIETAIILLAKREGTAWTHKNIVRGAILPMIINNKLPSMYRAFCLLGNLMRVFPTEDKDNSVGEIVEQLCDLSNSDEGSDEQKEGIISALLSLSRHKFDEVVINTLRWIPSVPLRDRTYQQMNGLFNWRTAEFWKGYLKRNRQLLNV